MYGFRAKLATMGAGKTEDLIREYYTHKRKVDRTGATILTLKPSKDTRNSGIKNQKGRFFLTTILWNQKEQP